MYSHELRREVDACLLDAMRMGLDERVPYVTIEGIAATLGVTSQQVMLASLEISLFHGVHLAPWDYWRARISLHTSQQHALAPVVHTETAQQLTIQQPASAQAISPAPPRRRGSRGGQAHDWVMERMKQIYSAYGSPKSLRHIPRRVVREMIREVCEAWKQAADRWGYEPLPAADRVCNEVLRCSDGAVGRAYALMHGCTLRGYAIDLVDVPEHLRCEDWDALGHHQQQQLCDEISVWAVENIDLRRYSLRTLAMSSGVPEFKLSMPLRVARARAEEVVQS
jgi:hypothetical protein